MVAPTLLPPSPPLSALDDQPLASTSTSPFPSPSTSSIPSSPNSSGSSSVPRRLVRARKPGPSPAKGKKKRAGREDEAVKLCEAVDRTDKRCENVVVGGHKGKVRRSWCGDHEAEELGVRAEFERCASLLVAGTTLTPSLAAISAETLSDKLKGVEEATRERWGLADKALNSRKYHRSHFSSAPDFGRDMVGPLKRIREELESRLRVINSRAHNLILTSEDATWLLPQTLPTPSPSHPPPFHPPSPSSDLRPPSSPPLQAFSEEPDPVLAKERVRRAELLELISLTGSHASFIRDARKSVERVRVVECLMRRVISRDEVLLVRAYRGGHDHVLRFFEDPLCCTLVELSRLWSLLQRTSVVQIKEAVMDAFRAMKWEESGAGETETGEEGLGLQLIGGWTYKVQLSREMEWKEWGHIYDLLGCSNCAQRICASFAEWARIRRLTVVPHGTHPPPYELWGDADESDASRIFRALDVVKCREERGGEASEVRTVAGGFVGAGKGKGVWVERIERNWVYFKIAHNHSKSKAIISTLSETHVVLARSSISPLVPLTTFPLPPPPDLWFSRHRSSPSRPSLRHEPWQTDPHAFPLPPSTLLSTTFTRLEQGQGATEQGWKDATFSLLVLDAHGREGEGSGRTAGTYVPRTYERFEAEVGESVARACGVDGVKGALEGGEAESLRKGEMLWEFKEEGKGLVGAGGGKSGGEGRGKEREGGRGATKKLLDELRDDKLAFRLSRSLFR